MKTEELESYLKEYEAYVKGDINALFVYKALKMSYDLTKEVLELREFIRPLTEETPRPFRVPEE